MTAQRGDLPSGGGLIRSDGGGGVVKDNKIPAPQFSIQKKKYQKINTGVSSLGVVGSCVGFFQGVLCAIRSRRFLIFDF